MLVSWEFGMPVGPNIFMAMEVFFCHVLRILLSEIDESQKQNTLGIKVSCCANASKKLLQRAILYRRKKIYVGKGDGGQYQAETMCKIEMVI